MKHGSSARWLALLLVIGSLVVWELRKPADQRTWHGEIAGVVPYDILPPTLDRIRNSWWNPESERLLTPQVFGLGWSINVGRVARRIGLA